VGFVGNDVFIAGDAGTIMRLRWCAVEYADGANDARLACRVGARADGSVAAGDSGTVLRFDGKQWSMMGVPSNKIIYSLFGIGGTTSVAAVGEAAKILEGVP
jgi:hypothetical protein